MIQKKRPRDAGARRRVARPARESRARRATGDATPRKRSAQRHKLCAQVADARLEMWSSPAAFAARAIRKCGAARRRPPRRHGPMAPCPAPALVRASHVIARSGEARETCTCARQAAAPQRRRSGRLPGDGATFEFARPLLRTVTYSYSSSSSSPCTQTASSSASPQGAPR